MIGALPLVNNPITLTSLEPRGIAERNDIIVDFSRFRVGDKLHPVEGLRQTADDKPDTAVALAQTGRGAGEARRLRRA